MDMIFEFCYILHEIRCKNVESGSAFRFVAARSCECAERAYTGGGGRGAVRQPRGGVQLACDVPQRGGGTRWKRGSAAGDIGLSLTNYMRRPYLGGIGGINLAGHEKGSIECYWWRHYPLV